MFFMKIDLLKASLLAVVFLSVGINVFHNKDIEHFSEPILANVEALAEVESGNVMYKYCTIHVRCFNYNGSATGKYTADSYRGESCRYETSHEHSCDYCSSR